MLVAVDALCVVVLMNLMKIMSEEIPIINYLYNYVTRVKIIS